MKTLEEYISTIVPYFDEDETDQTELLKKGYNQYQKDLIVNNIGKKENIYNIELFLNELLKNLDFIEKQDYIKKILQKLIDEYFLNVLIVNIDANTINYDKVIDLLKFLELNRYQEFFSLVFPYVDISYQQEQEKISKFIDDNFFIINQKIELNKSKCPEYLNYFFKYTSKKDFIAFFTKLFKKDVLSIIVLQNQKKGD